MKFAQLYECARHIARDDVLLLTANTTNMSDSELDTRDSIMWYHHGPSVKKTDHKTANFDGDVGRNSCCR